MKRLIVVCILISVLISGQAAAVIRNVPGEYPNIQNAINACGEFDTVVVSPGTYSGSGNRYINFYGKAITVRSENPNDSEVVSSTVIDSGGNGVAFVFFMGEGNESKVSGLTIKNGYGLLGGAVYCYNNSSPTISNCVFTKNRGVFGGAVAVANSGSKPIITNCLITSNTALVGGGGIYCSGASPQILNCVISGNSAPDGGAVYSHNPGTGSIVNCTITSNSATNSTGGIYCFKASNLTISNCILWDNTASKAAQMWIGELGDVTNVKVSYCDIQGAQADIVVESGCTLDWGPGNIDVDPKFVEVVGTNDGTSIDSEDAHLDDGSPCINAGDPTYVAAPDATDIDGGARISGASIDIGADEYVMPIQAVVNITPKSLNLSSKGQYISCSIELLDGGYSIGDIDTSTIVLNNQVVAAWSEIDSDKLVVKFDRSDVQNLLADTLESEALLSVRGRCNDGTDFQASDTIKLIRQYSKK